MASAREICPGGTLKFGVRQGDLPGDLPGNRLAAGGYLPASRGFRGIPREVGSARGRNRRFRALPFADDLLLRPKSDYTAHDQLRWAPNRILLKIISLYLPESNYQPNPNGWVGRPTHNPWGSREAAVLIKLGDSMRNSPMVLRVARFIIGGIGGGIRGFRDEFRLVSDDNTAQYWRP